MLRLLRSRSRARLLTTLSGGSTVRYTQLVIGLAVLRRVRAMLRPKPETLYVGTLGRDGRLDVATSKPLPRRLRTRKVWKAFEADARAEATGS